MATINFRLKGKNIYLGFSISRGKVFERKSGFSINPKDWSVSKRLPIDRDENSRILKNRLLDLAENIERNFHSDFTNGIDIDSNWLQQTINKFHGQNETNESQNFTFWIQSYINNAPTKQLKKKIGLSDGRIKNIKLFKNTWLNFEAETNKGKSIDINKINRTTIKNFNNWLSSKNYSINYIGKNLSNLKTVLNDYLKENEGSVLLVNPLNIQTPTETKEPEDIIYLNFEELQKIKDLKLVNNHLENARKWLILGCYVGQRGGDLLKLKTDKIKIISGKKAFVIRQEKTRKDTVIPILPEAEEVINSGFPYPISQTKLREYFKKLCQLANINEPKRGRIKETSTGATKTDIVPKWQLIGTHVCRRSFCSNFYGSIPTPVLMQISNHGTEKMFLAYIGKPPYEYAMTMLDYVEKLPQQSNLRVLKNSKNGSFDN